MVARQGSPDGPKILIAEDEQITAHHLRQSLTRFGYHVVAVASTGLAAIEEAERNRPDLLLADIGLKGALDGVAVATQVRERWHIPTVFLTAYTDSETMKRARIAEPYGYLTKPFAEEELHATIEIALRQRDLLENSQDQRRLNLNTIERTQDELNILTAKLVSAQEEERQRIARDLHDDVSQRLAVAAIDLTKLAEQLPAESAKSQCYEIRSQLDALSEDIRKISHNLHPSIIEHLGLVPALRNLAADFEQRESIPTCFSARAVPPFVSRETQMGLYRVVQEALRNVAKHAAAKSVDIALVGGPEELYLSVRDVGRGFHLAPARTQPGLGLVSMTQRAQVIGGVLDVQSEPGVGTQIILRVPLKQRREALA